MCGFYEKMCEFLPEKAVLFSCLWLCAFVEVCFHFSMSFVCEFNFSSNCLVVFVLVGQKYLDNHICYLFVAAFDVDYIGI